MEGCISVVLVSMVSGAVVSAPSPCLVYVPGLWLWFVVSSSRSVLVVSCCRLIRPDLLTILPRSSITSGCCMVPWLLSTGSGVMTLLVSFSGCLAGRSRVYAWFPSGIGFVGRDSVAGMM